jgi:hypothetical protein
VIARSVDDNFPHVDPVEFDRILDAAEVAMHAVASEHRLRETTFVRWRWDQPEILMSWTPLRQYPTAGKNIRVHVEPESQSLFTCTFESNAWFDERRTPDSFVRFWDHFPVGSKSRADSESVQNLEAPFIREYVERAYEAVSDTSEVRLSRAILISPDGEAHELKGSTVIGKDSVTFHVSIVP